MSFSLDGKAISTVQLGIPVPTRPGGKASPERSALEDMEAGESRVFTGYKSRMLVSTCASIRKKFPERRYAVRSMGGGSPVIRVWRME